MASPQTEDGFTKIANELLEAFSQIDASGSAWRVFMVVLRKTYGFHKKSDKISLTQFEDMSRLTRVSVCRGINELIELNIITVEKDGYINEYSIQKNYGIWGSIKPVTSNKNDTESSIKPVTKTSNKNDTNKRKKDNKDISEQSSQLNEKDMGWKPYNENTHADDIPSIGDDGEIVKTEEALKKEQNEKVTALIEWAEKVRKKKFIDITTQRKMIHDMRKAKISPDVIKETYRELLHSEYWTTGDGKDRLPDFKTVFSSLKNKK